MKTTAIHLSRLSLALQGGGAFGAFTWGVLDRLLEEDGLGFDVASGASAGAINAVLLASGLIKGGPEEARSSLERFWRRVAGTGLRKLIAPFPELAAAAAGHMSPYQFNPLDLNPLRALLLEEVDFEAVRKSSPVRLLVSATRVQDGALRIFRTRSMSVEVVLASACLPRLHHAIDIDGEPHWDGGFSANPPLFPAVTLSRTPDVLLVQVIPTDHPELPVTRSEIERRVGRITFNGPLQKDLETLRLMQGLIRDEGKPISRLGRKLDELRLHHISAEAFADGLRDLSILNTDWELLTHLRDRGRVAAEAWITAREERSGPDECSPQRRIAAQPESPKLAA